MRRGAAPHRVVTGVWRSRGLTRRVGRITFRSGGTCAASEPGGPMSTTDASRAGARSIDLDAPAPTPPHAAPTATPTDTVRDAIHAGTCVLAGVLVTVGFVLDPASDADSAAEIVAAATDDPGAFYWSNTIAAFGLAMVAAVGLAVMRLVRGRGRVVATVGGLLTMIGGIGAGAAIFMYGAVLAGMAESDVETSVLVELQDHLEDSMRPGLAFVLGFLPLMLGLLLCGIALLLSRAVPTWVGPVLIAGVVAIMVFGDGTMARVGDVVLAVGLAAVGVYLWLVTSVARRA